MTPYQYLIVSSLCFLLLPYRPVWAGDYLDSAHGNPGISSYGVNRSSTSIETGKKYARGNCAHCHEQHASIEGDELIPTGGPDDYLLFNPNHTSQTVNFCFDCHQSGGYQTGGISLNKSYSYNFGGNTTGGSYDSNIKDSFSHIVATGSSHHLPDFITQVLGKTMYDANGVEWSLPADINPCDACHNPHLAQRNVNTPYDATKSAISRPSDHDNRWGDDEAERMYPTHTDYMAPYWWGSSINHEPANNSTTNGSNLPDYNRLCTDCHNDRNTINSTNPRLPNTPRAIIKFSWENTSPFGAPDGHGSLDGAGIEHALPPYTDGSRMTLCCTDCHEPHGSATNLYLIRSSVNKKSVLLDTVTDTSWESLCMACHDFTHDKGSKCSECHFHSNTPGSF